MRTSVATGSSSPETDLPVRGDRDPPSLCACVARAGVRRSPTPAPVDGRLACRADRANAMINRQQIRAVLGAGGQVVDSAGQQVGCIVDVALSPPSHQPARSTTATSSRW